MLPAYSMLFASTYNQFPQECH